MSGRRRLARPAGAGAAVLALTGLLAACSGSGNGGVATPATSPLAEILGWGMMDEGAAGGGRQISEAERERHDRAERLTAECMAERGFDYVPVSLEDLASGPFDEAYALPAEDFAAEYGYGVTTLFPPDEQAAPDPNQEIQAGLSAELREAYRRALWGDAVAEGDGSDPGCQMLANQQVYDSDPRADAGQPQFTDLFEALDALWVRIENDPRLHGTDQDWVACMAQAGYPGFTRPHDTRQTVFDAMAALRATGDPDPADVAALRDYELTLAPVDLRCREVHIDGPRREVAYELETEFVAEHRAELEAYRDWVTGDGPGG